MDIVKTLRIAAVQFVEQGGGGFDVSLREAANEIEQLRSKVADLELELQALKQSAGYSL